MPNMGIKDVKKIYTAEDLAPGKNIIFAATGVTESPLFRGVRFFGGGFRTSSLVMARAIGSIRFVDTIHVNQTDQPTSVSRDFHPRRARIAARRAPCSCT